MTNLIAFLFLSLLALSKDQVRDKNFHFVSPFKPTVEGNYCLPNLHQVDKGGYIFRGMAPYKSRYIQDLTQLNIAEVLIFKDNVDHFMKTEIEELKKLNIKHHLIRFPYKDIKSFSPVCKQTIKALKLFKKAILNKKRLFFHCTVGEDRTGYLAGLFDIWQYKSKPKEVFQSKMCRYGFGKGNPDKPFDPVVTDIRKALTPLYSKMSFLIIENNYSLNKIEEKNLCENYSFKNKKYSSYKKNLYKYFRCDNQKVFKWTCSPK